MLNHLGQRLILSLIVMPALVGGQTFPTGSLPLIRSDAKATALPPATASTRLDFQVDASTASGDFFDVIVDSPQVVVTLITPSACPSTRIGTPRNERA